LKYEFTMMDMDGEIGEIPVDFQDRLIQEDVLIVP
jgi:hypothetical protein